MPDINNRVPKYNFSELDSLSKILLNDFNNANYDIILEKIPALIDNAILIDAYELELKLKNNLGNTFVQLEDYENADILFNKALDIAKKKNDTLSMLNSYINLGNTYFNKDREKAVRYFKKGLEYDFTGQMNEILDYVLNSNLAELYMEMEKPILARQQLSKITGNIYSDELERIRPYCLGSKAFIEGGIYLTEKKPKKAEESILESLRYQDYLDENYRIGNYKRLISAYEMQGNYLKTVETYKVYDSIRDIKYEKEKVKQLQIARTEANLDRMEQELRESQLENELVSQKAQKSKMYLISVIAFCLILVFVASILLWSKRKRDRLFLNLIRKNKQYLEAKENSEKLAKSNTRFLSTITHELRTPLYGIIGLSNLFLTNPKLSELKDDFKSLKFSADYLLSLVNDVLSINKLSSKNGQELKRVRFEIEPLVNNVIESFSFLNKKHNNKVVLDFDKNIPSVLIGDKNKLLQILMNLMSNASKFTEDGTVTLRVIKENITEDIVSVLFEVSDTGIGIHPDKQKSVFEEFSQGDNSFDDDIKGTGLGLSIVNKVLSVFDSKLKMQSTLNVGSEFSFIIDLTICKKGDFEVLPIPIVVESLKNKKVLIVDDNKINRLVTKKLLDQNFMLYESAKNGKEAVEMVEKETFDFILMDINMPVMNGLEATQKIRTFDTKTPIIALTATNFSDPENEVLSYGVNSIVVKPYTMETLLEKFIELIR